MLVDPEQLRALSARLNDAATTVAPPNDDSTVLLRDRLPAGFGSGSAAADGFAMRLWRPRLLDAADPMPHTRNKGFVSTALPSLQRFTTGP
ncbi:hypothetical protein [Nocardia sp. NPDC019395]|uniref:hypothetical protein n=1 Tax=Nocardia sp. NPDC019395 TaxID=3154686 RepID=UPI0033CCB0DE